MSRRRAVAVVAAVLLAGAARARAQDPAAAAEVLKREDARVQAMLKADVAALEDVLADDLTYTHSNAKVETRREFIDEIRSGRLKYKSIEREGVAVRVYGDDAAIITGSARIQVRSGDADLDVRLRFTDVYVKRGGTWRMVAWQSTRLPEK